MSLTYLNRLTSELASLEPYQDAFYQLNERVESLLARKKVAEDEAAELCQFNAQILGHHNPAQRIVYVDRIRRELAESKQRISDLVVEQERLNTHNDHIQQELDTYKSVMVPPANKPKTHITRIMRPPLASMSQSMNRSHAVRNRLDGPVKENQGDFTVEELEQH